MEALAKVDCDLGVPQQLRSQTVETSKCFRFVNRGLTLQVKTIKIQLVAIGVSEL